MRVLFASWNLSPFTGKPIVSQSISEMVDKIKNYQRQHYLSSIPIVRGRKENIRKKF